MAIDKLLIYDPEDDHGRHFFKASELVSNEKIASDYDWSPEVKGIVSKIKPDPKRTVVLLNAMGAGEFYGANSRGDYFRESELIDNYTTFEHLAKVFRHHKNKMGDPSYGKVMSSVWNPRMHRIELVISIDREKAPDIATDIDNDKFPSVSMGCRVVFDICSVCGKKNPTISSYCGHLKNHMLEILEDGRQVYADNIKPRFFDLSFVRVGADKTARVLRKVASGGVIPSAYLFEAVKSAERQEAAKLASDFPWEKLIGYETAIPSSKGMSKEAAWQILSSLVKLGIMPNIKEFEGFMKAADIAPDGDVELDLYSQVELPKLAQMSPVRSAFSPFLENRIVDAVGRNQGKEAAEIKLAMNGNSVMIQRDPECPWVGVSEKSANGEDGGYQYAKMFGKFADAALDYLHNKVDSVGYAYLCYRVSPRLEKSAMAPKDQMGMELFLSKFASGLVLSDVQDEDLKMEVICRLGTTL